jgi:hypothetical protein
MTLLIEQRVTSLEVVGQGIDAKLEIVFEKVSLATVGVQGPPGPLGPQGVAGGIPSKFIAALAGTWIIPHLLGRIPIVQVFLPNGELVNTDVSADEININVMFAMPTAGFVLAY